MNQYYYYPIDYNLYGYTTLSQIYQNLIDATTNSTETNLRLKTATDKEIRDKLERLKKSETELADAIKNAELKNRLAVASRGMIDPDKIPDDALASVLEKHSNLLGLTKTYNSKVKNLADILQVINKIVAEKTNGRYGVNVSIGYPTAVEPGIPWY